MCAGSRQDQPWFVIKFQARLISTKSPPYYFNEEPALLLTRLVSTKSPPYLAPLCRAIWPGVAVRALPSTAAGWLPTPPLRSEFSIPGSDRLPSSHSCAPAAKMFAATSRSTHPFCQPPSLIFPAGACRPLSTSSWPKLRSGVHRSSLSDTTAIT